MKKWGLYYWSLVSITFAFGWVTMGISTALWQAKFWTQKCFEIHFSSSYFFNTFSSLASVTRFGHFCRFFANFINCLRTVEGLFSMWQNIEHTLANFSCCWTSSHWCKCPNIEQIFWPLSGHTAPEPHPHTLADSQATHLWPHDFAAKADMTNFTKIKSPLLTSCLE